jgi:hypothetical protein
MTTPRRLADRVIALAGCVDVSGFTPFFAPLMFSLNENSWPTMTLIMSLVAILLIIFAIVGWRRGCDQPSGNSVIAARRSGIAAWHEPVEPFPRLSTGIDESHSECRFSTATSRKAVPVNTRVRRVRLATRCQEFATVAWRCS